MHDVDNVAHLDLYARNVMIDNATLQPRVIDFGRAAILTESMPEMQKNLLKDRDWETLDKIYQKVDKFIK